MGATPSTVATLRLTRVFASLGFIILGRSRSATSLVGRLATRSSLLVCKRLHFDIEVLRNYTGMESGSKRNAYDGVRKSCLEENASYLYPQVLG